MLAWFWVAGSSEQAIRNKLESVSVGMSKRFFIGGIVHNIMIKNKNYHNGI
ncbi:hypothetical protein GCM10022277_03230 [Litoribacillus peritrichatus]|uniref:Uncharacterized protein n=1 Tax=Litoribacillus peritrichatus TaxID=718191 RepID=A0ABP7M031_9GAMM